MVDERSGGGHGETGEEPDPFVSLEGEVLTEEQIEQVEKADTTSVRHHGSRKKKDDSTAPQVEQNLRSLITKSNYDLEARVRLRAHAAVIAVDMERGVYRKGGRPWTNGISITEIMRAMGYYIRPSDNRRNFTPVIFKEPEWGRAVEWERIKRDASYRLEMEGLMPLMRVGLNAMLFEVIRRAMVDPQNIPSHVLFAETRKMMDVVAEFGRQKKASEVDDMMAKFMETVKHLPEGAREIAVQAFQTEVRMLFKTTDNAKIILSEVEGQTGKSPDRVPNAERAIISGAA